jgi:putative tricarboxylic transport membrane protein
MLVACAPAATPSKPAESKPAAPAPAPAAAPAASPAAAAKPAESKPGAPAPAPAASPAAAAKPAEAAKPATKIDYPTTTIVFTTHSNPGGGGDLLGRQLTEALKGQNITAVLENKAGGSGAVNMGYVAGRPADGYTAMIVTLSNLITPHLAGTPLDYKSFKPVARLQLEDEIILVHKDSPHQTIESLIEASKKGGVKWGGGFIGNIDSFVAYSLAQKAGFTVEYVPFEGGGEANTALLGKHVDAIVTNPAEGMAQIEAGELRPLAMPNAQRSPYFPNVPTLKEKGFDVVMEQWRGVWLHKDADDAIVNRLAEVLQQATKTESFQKYTKEGLLTDAYLGPKEFQAALEAQEKEVSALVDQLNLRNSQKKS